MSDPQMELFDVARARRTDPSTSHAAAASVTDLRVRQQAVWSALVFLGPSTDEALVAAYPDLYPHLKQSPSGLRTRRRELCDLGLVKATDEKRRLASGRLAQVWRVVR